MTPEEFSLDEEEHFLLWEDELPPRTLEETEELAEIEAQAILPFVFVVEDGAFPKKEPGFLRQLWAWLMLIMVVSLPWAAGFLLVITIIKALL